MASLKYIADVDLMTVTLTSDYTAADGHMHLTAGHGARLPAAGDFWLRTTSGTYRCFKVTVRSTDDITITAAQDGTSDGNLSAGAELKWVLGYAALIQLISDIRNVERVGDGTGNDFWGFKIELPNAGDNLILGYTGTTYSSALAWLAANIAFLYYPITFFIGTGIGSTPTLALLSTGNIGAGIVSPTAVLHLKAGSATASTAPLKLTAGTLLGTPEAGAIEFDGSDFYLTI